MNAFDIAIRRTGATARRQPTFATPRAGGVITAPGDSALQSWNVAGHWLGVLDRALIEATDAPGILGEAARWQIGGEAKRVRARLALAAGHALGADMLAVVKVAAAVELLHEASLVHDDLQDRDTLRRGRKTVWVEFGEELAITLGDWMINQAYDVLLEMEIKPTVLRRIARAMSKAVGETVRGQAIENANKASLTHTPEHYIDMATRKTAPLLAFPLEAVALLAGRPDCELQAIRSGLECLGGAYQLRDDLIDLLGAKGRGSAGADFVEGKATLPLILFYANADIRGKLETEAFISAEPAIRKEGAAQWAGVLVDSPAFDHVVEMTEQLTEMGYASLRAAPCVVSKLVHMVFSRLLVPVERPAPDCRAAMG